MRLTASSDSVAAGELSLLAVLECVAAIAVYVALSVHLHTSLPFAVAVAFAPLLLLRTPRSIEFALRLYTRANDRVGKLFDRHVFIFLYSPVIAICGIVIRIAATAWCAARHPIESLQSIPANWVRQALCTDLTIPPEIVPEESRLGDEVPTLEEVGDLIRQSDWNFGTFFGFVTVLLPILILGYLPALLLRVSFKASSLVYAPFVWVAHTSLNSALPLALRLERIVKGELEKARRVLSLAIATAFVLKLLVAFEVLSLAEVAARVQSEFVLRLVGQVAVWPLWQWNLLTEAALTFLLFFFADAALSRITAGKAWPEPLTQHFFDGIVFVRALLAIAAIVSVFVLSATRIQRIVLAQLGAF